MKCILVVQFTKSYRQQIKIDQQIQNQDEKNPSKQRTVIDQKLRTVLYSS